MIFETQHLGIKAKLIQHGDITSTVWKMSEDPDRDQMTILGAFFFSACFSSQENIRFQKGLLHSILALQKLAQMEIPAIYLY